jgi:hypothetical protein
LPAAAIPSQTRTRSLAFFALVLVIAQIAYAQVTIPLEDAVKAAASRSTLVSPGAAPFHLQATISDQKQHDPQWDATVEEWWQSPTVWRREFHSLAFSQTILVNGSKVEEHDAGPVFPELLRNLTVELVDTVPRLDQLAALHQTVAKPDGTPGQIRASWFIPGRDGTTTKSIAASIAISRDTGLMLYGGDIDWDVSLHDFSDFHGKQIARRLTAQSQGGPQLTANMTLLEDLNHTPGLFVVRKSTPAKHQLRVAVVPELTLRALSLANPVPRWPDLPSGPLVGAMVMRVVVDRQGHVSSVDDFFSDNPALQKAAQQQIIHWRFRPHLDHGIPVQVISTLTFPFAINRATSPPETQR